MNILLIVMDDIGVQYCDPYWKASWSNSQPLTPTLNTMATNGLVFDQFHSGIVCSQARWGFERGRLPFRDDIGTVVDPDGVGPRTDPQQVRLQIANLLKRKGYDTALFGKWHLSDDGQFKNHGPTRAGYDKWAGVRGNLTAHNNYTYVNIPHNVTPTAAAETNAGTTTYSGTKAKDDAVAWINDAARADKPWFCQVAFHPAHSPHNYDQVPTDLHTYDTAPVHGTVQTPPDSDEFLVQVQAVDTLIGQLLTSITSGSNFDYANDVVIVIGDNGTPSVWADTPFDSAKSKGFAYHQGTWVPLIMRGAAVVNAGRRTAALAHVVDLYPTIAELGGYKYDELGGGFPLDGVSLLDVMARPGSPGTRKWIYRERFADEHDESIGYHRGLTDGEYDLVHDFGVDSGVGRPEFFNLIDDPYEQTDLFGALGAAGVARLTEEELAGYSRLRGKLDELETAHALGRAAGPIDPSVL